MNLILFDVAETEIPISRNDPRAVHLLTVLRRQKGDTFDAGIVNGPRGKGRLVAIDATTLTLKFTWQEAAAAPEPICLIIGIPRPQTARDILRDATTLGLAAIHFVTAERSDSNYAKSKLWSTGEWQRIVGSGAEQAFTTQLPMVTWGRPFAEVIASLEPRDTRLALDNYESPTSLSQVGGLAPRVTLAVGPERGWSGAERVALRSHGFQFAHLGPRVLRTETACIVALALVRSKLGLM